MVKNIIEKWTWGRSLSRRVRECWIAKTSWAPSYRRVELKLEYFGYGWFPISNFHPNGTYFNNNENLDIHIYIQSFMNKVFSIKW
jgi:hypothetical protein